MKRRTTLRDVAEAAKVSVMTVSNVINGKFEGMTSETQARIERAVEELGYRPDLGARGLRKGRRFSLGMLILDRSPRFLADPWITNLVAGVSNYLRECDYGLLLHGSDGRNVDQMSMIRHSSTDGMLALFSGPPELRQNALSLLRETGQPLILFQEPLAEPVEDACVFRQSDRDGALALGRLVLERRPRRVVMLVSDWEWPAMVQRELGFRDAITEAGGDIQLDVVSCPEDNFAGIVAVFEAHVDRHGLPDAVLGGNDQIAFAAMRYLRRAGVSVPGDVAVTGFNDFDFARYTEPELTTVTSPAYALGREGAAALLARLESGRFDRSEVVLPVKVHPGGTTTAAPPAAPPFHN